MKERQNVNTVLRFISPFSIATKEAKPYFGVVLLVASQPRQQTAVVWATRNLLDGIEPELNAMNLRPAAPKPLILATPVGYSRYGILRRGRKIFRPYNSVLGGISNLHARQVWDGQ